MLVYDMDTQSMEEELKSYLNNEQMLKHQGNDQPDYQIDLKMKYNNYEFSVFLDFYTT